MNLVDPDVAPALWRLAVDGVVERPFAITLGELRAMDTVTQETTLECISNGVGYGLLSNATWTGGPARPAGRARHAPAVDESGRDAGC